MYATQIPAVTAADVARLRQRCHQSLLGQHSWIARIPEGMAAEQQQFWGVSRVLLIQKVRSRSIDIQ